MRNLKRLGILCLHIKFLPHTTSPSVAVQLAAIKVFTIYWRRCPCFMQTVICTLHNMELCKLV